MIATALTSILLPDTSCTMMGVTIPYELSGRVNQKARTRDALIHATRTLLADALAPLRGRMREDDLRRLIYGIGATLGIEAFVWLTDVAGLEREEAAAIMCSNASGLLRNALAAHGA